MRHVAATIVAKNQLAAGRVVARSFREHHPRIPFYLLLADESEDLLRPADEPCTVIGVDELSLPHPQAFRFRYEQQAFSYACTPFLLSHLLGRGFDAVLFFKQESLILGNMEEVFERLEHAPMVLTPHLVSPLPRPAGPGRELQILLSGVYNIGMVGAASRPEVRRFLSWWEGRVERGCLHDVARGLHFEQRWMDMAPSYVPGLEYLREPHFNVAHWNLPDRRVVHSARGWLVDGEPCRLFRYSGFDPDLPQRPTRYFDRLDMASVGDAALLYERYVQLLQEEGFSEVSRWSYAWDRFDNGVPIPTVARQVFREEEDEGRYYADPFDAAAGDGFYRRLQEPVPHGGAPSPVSRLWYGVWRMRRDLQRAFVDPLGADAPAFLEWCAGSGTREHEVPEPLQSARS